MANIKKNFNFRNGVQVDDDNLLVTATGLVGIGTTVPTEALDVRGNVKIIGDATITNATVGVLTITNVVPTQVIGAGVSIKSGIITAQGSGIVTFYGDGINLLNLPTSQWEDTNAGFGVSSIYNTGGTVGIATTNPKSTIQIGDNPDIVGGRGVGISSVGDINASGIISATTFKGALTGNVTGNLTGVAASTTQLQTARTIGGVSFDGTSNINLPGVNIAGNQDTSGSAASLSGTPNISIGIINASGISTFSNNVAFYPPIGGQVDFFGGATDGLQRMRWRNNGSNSMLHFSDNVHAVFGSDSRTQFDPHGSGSAGHFRIEQYMDNGNNPFQIHSDFTNVMGSPTGGHEGRKIADFNYSDGTKLYHFGVQKLQTSGIGVTITSQLDTTNIVASGVITATTELNSPLIGVGTDTPANDIQVRKSGNTEIQVTSDTGIAGLTVGREPSTGNTNNAEFRYGGGAGANYSTPQSLDIINYGTHNFNYYLSANNPGAVVGDYHWHKGLNSARLMTLTNTGLLGIGQTQPTTTLHVQGISTVTSNSFVGGNFNVSGNTVIGGNLTLSGSLGISAISADITGNVTGNLTGNVDATSGISSFRKIGINTTVPTDSVDLDCLQGDAAFKRVGIGSTQPNAILDVGGDLSEASKKMIILPRVSAGSTSLVQADQPEGGGLIYNTTLRKLQFHNGTNWETVTSVEVTG